VSIKRKPLGKTKYGKRRKLHEGNRVFRPEFKVKACERMLAGMSVRQLSQELGVRRSVLYRWRDAYQQDGPVGVCRQAGRPRQTPAQRQAEIEASKDRKIGELERTVGQQTLEIRFLRRAFKRLEESRPRSTSGGGTASTEPSGK